MARVVELDVTPRLIRARQLARSTRPKDEAITARIDAEQVAAFASLVLHGDDQPIGHFVDGLRSRGASVEAIYIDLLPATARRLDALWDADSIHFIDVTLGLMRLQQIVRRCSDAFRQETPYRYHGRKVLLASMPGDQLSLDLSILSEFLHRAGWAVSGGPGLPIDEVIRMASGGWISFAALFVDRASGLDTLRQNIRQLRRRSRNADIRVSVGGRIITDHPELVGQLGADAMEADPVRVTLKAEAMAQPLRRDN